jgi:hypothetical protein
LAEIRKNLGDNASNVVIFKAAIGNDGIGYYDQAKVEEMMMNGDWKNSENYREYEWNDEKV